MNFNSIINLNRIRSAQMIGNLFLLSSLYCLYSVYAYRASLCSVLRESFPLKRSTLAIGLVALVLTLIPCCFESSALEPIADSLMTGGGLFGWTKGSSEREDTSESSPTPELSEPVAPQSSLNPLGETGGNSGQTSTTAPALSGVESKEDTAVQNSPSAPDPEPTVAYEPSPRHHSASSAFQREVSKDPTLSHEASKPSIPAEANVFDRVEDGVMLIEETPTTIGVVTATTTAAGFAGAKGGAVIGVLVAGPAGAEPGAVLGSATAQGLVLGTYAKAKITPVNDVVDAGNQAAGTLYGKAAAEAKESVGLHQFNESDKFHIVADKPSIQVPDLDDVIHWCQLWTVSIWISGSVLVFRLALARGLRVFLERCPPTCNFALKHPKMYSWLNRLCTAVHKNHEAITSATIIVITATFIFLTGNIWKLVTIINQLKVLANSKEKR